MDVSSTMAFWGVSMLFVLTPGVDWAFAISSGLKHGGTAPAIFGMLAGHLSATLIVSAGVAAVITASETTMLILTGAGACYLIWLGFSALLHPAAPDLEGERVPVGGWPLFTKGVGISLLNPKVFLLFLALLPQFTSTEGTWSTGLQMITLGVIHVANCALVYFAVGFGAGALLSRRPRAAKIVGIVSGIVMIGLGIILLGEKAMSMFA